MLNGQPGHPPVTMLYPAHLGSDTPPATALVAAVAMVAAASAVPPRWRVAPNPHRR